MMLSDVCLSNIWRLSDVCRVHPVGGRRVRPTGWMARAGWSARLGRPGSRLPLRTSVAGLGGPRGQIVAAARLRLVWVYFNSRGN